MRLYQPGAVDRRDSFNPRTPCGVRPTFSPGRLLLPLFQSTHSLRSATGAVDVHSPDYYVSIHALLAECDTPPYKIKLTIESFNPRTPCGVRPGLANHFKGLHPVSIHALLAECDLFRPPLLSDARSFNPRTPCGVRLVKIWDCPSMTRFQSTHSLRSATARTRAQVMSMRGVSIHALLAECDRLADQPVDRPGRFNPRTPCGVRLGTTIGLAHACEFQSTHSLRSATSHLPPLPCIEPFQSTHSLRSATLNVSEKARPLVVSIHALLAECDHRILSCRCPYRGFNPRTPCGVRQQY